MEKQTGAFSFPPLVPWWGVVEKRTEDPKKLGRVKVRIYGYHTGDKGKMPTDDLPWALVLQTPTSAAVSGIGQSPTGMLEGTTVFGYFLDGDNCQTPLVVGTIAGINSGEGFQGGYKDPNGKYPKHKGENDVNRLARNEKISETIVQKKKDGIDTGKKAFGGEFTEPTTPYKAKYPYNHVRETESGHIEEFDDTKGAERYALWHKAGTFEEIHPDGTKVIKVVKDNYHITAADDYVLIKGNANVHIKGDSSLVIDGDVNIEVSGNVKEKVAGNYELTIGGSYNVKVGGSHTDIAGGQRKIRAARIDLN